MSEWTTIAYRSGPCLAVASLAMAGLVACGGGAADADGSSAGTPSANGAGGASGANSSSGSTSVMAGPAGSGGSAASTNSASSNPSSTSSSDGGGGGSSVDAPTEMVEYVASTSTIRNPERGFYSYVDLLGGDDFETAIERGHTLVFSYVHLDAYRGDDELPASLFEDLDAAFARLRVAGLKVILRFAYNEGPYPDPEPDAPLDRVLAHIEQLTPFLQDNYDAIAVLQGGFVGAWGEWHSSTNGLTEPAARQAIIEALLAALPVDRSVALRYPPYKEALYGAALEREEAFLLTPEARLGHHNDCFLSSESDVGTYPEDDIEMWKTYVADDTRFVPNGGETCAPFPPRSECGSALEEMERLHYSYMNQDYHPDVVDSWVQGGCKDEMDQRLGYRLVLVSADLAPAVRPGGSFELHIRIRNDGFATLMNPRTPMLWLHSGDGAWGDGMSSELRELLPGETMDVSAHVLLPSNIAEGPAVLSLGLQDSWFDSDPRYAVQLANEGTWDPESGLNQLGIIEVSNAAEGTSSPDEESLLAYPL